MKIKGLWKLIGGVLVVGSCSSLGLLFAQDAAPAGWTRGAAGRGPRVPPSVAWAPKPIKPEGWIAPNKPIWRLAEILAAHKGQADWTEPIVRDGYLQADYISMAPGREDASPL